jgi:hypothetical protein
MRKYLFALIILSLLVINVRYAKAQAVNYDTLCGPAGCDEAVSALPGNGAGTLYASLYPNPALNEINVVYDGSADVKDIAVYNLIGRVMMVYKVTGSSANLNIENIPAGIYFVRLLNTHGNVVITRRFTKQ